MAVNKSPQPFELKKYVPRGWNGHSLYCTQLAMISSDLDNHLYSETCLKGLYLEAGLHSAPLQNLLKPWGCQ